MIRIILCLAVFLSFANAEAMEKVVILGSGPAGLTSAIIAGQADLSPLVIEGEQCEGQLEIIHKIDNYPGFPEEIGGKELLLRFREQAIKFGARVEGEGRIKEVDLETRPFKIIFENDNIIETETLIIAQGVTKKWLGLDSEQELRGKGVMSTSICKRKDFEGKAVAVVGGGHAALQEALTIAEFASSVTIVNRSKTFNASAYHQNEVFSNEKIQVLYETEVNDILDISEDKVTGLALESKNGETFTLPVEGVVIAIGSTPNSVIFNGKLELTADGHVAISGKTTETNIPGVFAAGDVSEVSYGRVITAAGTGAMAALDTIKYLTLKLGRN